MTMSWGRRCVIARRCGTSVADGAGGARGAVITPAEVHERCFIRQAVTTGEPGVAVICRWFMRRTSVLQHMFIPTARDTPVPAAAP